MRITNDHSFIHDIPVSCGRLQVRPCVNLPDGEMTDCLSAAGYITQRRRNRRSDTRRNKPFTRAAKQSTGLYDSIWIRTMSVRTFCTACLSVLLLAGILLLSQWSGLRNARNLYISTSSDVTHISRENELLRQQFLDATSETAIAYSASHQLGLVAGEGVKAIPIMVPTRYYKPDQFLSVQDLVINTDQMIIGKIN